MCSRTRVLSTFGDKEVNFDFVTVDGLMYSAKTVLDLMVPNTFYVGLSSNSVKNHQLGSNLGFKMSWECLDQGFLTSQLSNV